MDKNIDLINLNYRLLSFIETILNQHEKFMRDDKYTHLQELFRYEFNDIVQRKNRIKHDNLAFDSTFSKATKLTPKKKVKIKTEDKKRNDAKYYYHGSPTEFTVLKPMPSGVINDESAVFATNTKWLAIFFIAKAKDIDIEAGFYNSKPYILEQYPGAFDNLLKNKSGYVHCLNKHHFRSDKRLGLQQNEFISNDEEKVVKTEKINDLYKSLKKTNVNIISYDEKMKCIELIIDKKIR